jgi:hypothetical protein
MISYNPRAEMDSTDPYFLQLGVVQLMNLLDTIIPSMSPVSNQGKHSTWVDAALLCCFKANYLLAFFPHISSSHSNPQKAYQPASTPSSHTKIMAKPSLATAIGFLLQGQIAKKR